MFALLAATAEPRAHILAAGALQIIPRSGMRMRFESSPVQVIGF